MQFSNPTFRSSGPPSRGPPSGPRPDAPFRGSSNSTSTTYPRSQRFNNSSGAHSGSSTSHHLADLPQPVKGGKKMDEYNTQSSGKLAKIEEELERMRASLAEKEARLRPELRSWSRLERESERAGFKSQMAEESLRGLSGDEAGGGVAF